MNKLQKGAILVMQEKNEAANFKIGFVSYTSNQPGTPCLLVEAADEKVDGRSRQLDDRD